MGQTEEKTSRSFDMFEYGTAKVGIKKLDNAVLDLTESINNQQNIRVTKVAVLEALRNNEVSKLRELSEYFYRTNGIYSRNCNYFAFLYRYDWYVVPEIYQHSKKGADKIIKEFYRILNYLDRSNIKKLCGDIALEVIVKGVSYCYIDDNLNQLILQQLPVKYCRSRYFTGGRPAVEFNMSYFDTFGDVKQRMNILKMFPKEFRQGYELYKKGKLKSDVISEGNGWYLLDPSKAFKFNFNQKEIPIFVNVLPYLLDLDAAQDLDRRKQMQKLLKILVQELPLDKNGDLVFDVDEAKDIHNNAVQMLQRAIGVDVLTTFTKVTPIDLADKNTATSVDDLEKVERALFNAFGVSQNLFNTDGNMSLEKSILNDEAAVRDLISQFNIFFNFIIQKIQKNKNMNFKFYLLETTIYNHKEMSKMYKEQTQLGYSKMLPQIALGHTQTAILNTAYFENDILDLSSIMIPPLMSSTLSGEDVLGKKNAAAASSEESTGGRPEKPDDQKSDKTIANKEAMG